MQSYFRPSQEQRFELEIKRSRFLTSITYVIDKAGAKSFIETLRKEFPDANHHCWATIAGSPDDVYQHDQSDDGEPKGTAGKPMLNVLQHSGLGNIVMVVTRYFGGIKLGAGGLVRAYTQCASKALQELQTTEYLFKQEMNLEMPYSFLSKFEHALQGTNIDITAKIFSDNVQLDLLVPLKDQVFLNELTITLGKGTFLLKQID